MIDRVRERIYPPDARQFGKYHKKEGIQTEITKKKVGESKIVRRKSGEVFIVVLGI